MTGIMGVLAVTACLATIGIVGYSMTGAGGKEEKEVVEAVGETGEGSQPEDPGELDPEPEENVSPEETASVSPAGDMTPVPVADLSGHVHDYEESVEKKATCYSAGELKYTCECGDSYYVDIMSTGHVADGWEVTRKPTADQDGLRVQKCIYCDEIMAQESIPYEDEDKEKAEEAAHIHQYTAFTEREPSCILAGLRKYSCTCGNFYTEMIPAPGHVATDWTVASEATTTQMGTEQRSCSVCGVVLDSRPINVIKPSPSLSPSAAPSSAAQASASGSGSPAAQSTPTPTAEPSPTPHEHNYTSYVLKQANCTEKGIRSFVCSCGSSSAESIELDKNNHTYRAVVIPATATTQGYTSYTCVRCNYCYFDNYTPKID